MKSPNVSLKRVGRPLSFDREKALEQAMLQFWRTGYDTTSVADLLRVMKITPPSLYAAFGDKEKLFLEALRRYTSPGPEPTAVLIEQAESSRSAAEQLLHGSAEFFTQPGRPAGCLVASAASTGTTSSRKVRAALSRVRAEIRRALESRIERDLHDGLLPSDTDAQALSATVIAVIQGMSTLARDGASREDLRGVVKVTMAAWPEKHALQV